MRFLTHSGVFHADEVMATAILRRAFGTDVPVLRVADASVAEPGDIVYDIGHGELDHHQKGGNGARPNGIPYASCGLVWRKFGHLACPEGAAAAVDRALVQAIDAVDCGVQAIRDAEVPVAAVSSVLAAFNPTWNDPMADDPAYRDARFMAAVDMADAILGNAIASAAANLEAEALVDEAASRAEGGVMVLDTYLPWERRLFQADPDAKVLFVVFPSIRGGWNWQAVPDKPGSFGQRKPCPEKFRGLRGGGLDEATGIPGGIFCHPAGFIGGHETKEGAIATARLLAAY